MTKYSSTNGVKYIIKNDELLLNVCDFENKTIYIYKVKTISNYILQNIIDNLQYFTNENTSDIFDSHEKDINRFKISEIEINKYEIEQYLKINKYHNELYIKLKWDIWKQFLLKVFTSKTIKDAFCQLNKKVLTDFDFYNILTEKELGRIFDNQIKFYMFPTNGILGLTITPILQIYEYYKGIDSAYSEDKSKLISLSFNLVTNKHEILGHFNIRTQKILLEKNIKSPISTNSKNLKKRIEESGEYIEQLLYGKVITNLTYNQMLFILDEENYNFSCDEFRKQFSQCNSKYTPSQTLKQFLASLGIEFDPKEDSSTLYTLNLRLSKEKNPVFDKPLQHVDGSYYYSPELEYKQLEKLRATMKNIIKKNNNNAK